MMSKISGWFFIASAVHVVLSPSSCSKAELLMPRAYKQQMSTILKNSGSDKRGEVGEDKAKGC